MREFFTGFPFPFSLINSIMERVIHISTPTTTNDYGFKYLYPSRAQGAPTAARMGRKGPVDVDK